MNIKMQIKKFLRKLTYKKLKDKFNKTLNNQIIVSINKIILVRTQINYNLLISCKIILI